jgi:hypothetical protein
LQKRIGCRKTSLATNAAAALSNASGKAGDSRRDAPPDPDRQPFTMTA